MKYDKDRHTHITGYVLTFGSRNGIVPGYGEVSERFKEPVLKTGDGATHRGFESHSLRQKKPTTQRVVDFFWQKRIDSLRVKC